MVEGELLRGWMRKIGVSQCSNSCVVYLVDVDGREILENENSDNCGLILENATSNSIPSVKNFLLC